MGGFFQTQIKAALAARTALGFELKAPDAFAPEIVLPVALNHADPEFFTVPGDFALALFIFIPRKDIGVVIIDNGGDVVFKLPLDDRG